jgi:CRP-like cAMP-binding protein
MSSIHQSTIENGLLKMLPSAAFARLSPTLALCNLRLGQVLVEPNRATDTVYFMGSGMASMVMSSGDDMTEIGYIGSEGMSAEHIVLACGETPARTFIQVAGQGYGVAAGLFEDVIRTDPSARRLFLRYVQFSKLQLAYTALANARCTVYERLARTLLIVHDRLDGRELPLTHGLLSIMLGVRRSSVTDSIHLLEGERAVRASRGVVHVLDRNLLENIAGRFYGSPEAEYKRLIGVEIDFGRGRDREPPVNGRHRIPSSSTNDHSWHRA